MVRALASISELVSAGRLVPQPADAAALHAVLLAGRRDFEAAEGADAVTIDAADVLTDQRHHPAFTRLQRMRRRRNDFMYETAPEPANADLDRARLDVSLLLDVAQTAIDGIS